MPTLQKSLDIAVSRENADPAGLPADMLVGMEADIFSNPDRYPAITAALALRAEDDRFRDAEHRDESMEEC